VNIIKQRTAFCLTIAVIVAVYLVNVEFIPPVGSCYGPCITSDIDKTQVNINDTVTVTGQVSPPAENKTIRVAFTKPDYTYVEQYILTDPKTGNFTVTQRLDMAGYWNIFAINGVDSDRLFAVVTDPSNPNAPLPSPAISLKVNTNYSLITATVALLSIGIVGVVYGARKKAIKISSFRFLVQIGLLFLIFFGVFVDHANFPIPAAQISPHENLVANSAFSVSMPDGLPVPFFGCYYPCGKTVTCALWQIQAYIYPFFNVGGGWGVHYTSTGVERLAVVFGIIIVAAVILGRVFCGWVCPFGLYVDVMTRIRKAVNVKRRSFSDKFNNKLHQLSYLILAFIIILSVVFSSEAFAGTQVVPGTQKGGFVWEYFSVPFCQVCPMRPLCILSDVTIGLMRPGWTVQDTTGVVYQLGFLLTSTNLIILALVTAAAFFFRRSWCQICPLGGLIALFNRFPPFKWISGVRLNKQEEKCKSCGICKRVCPTQVREVYDKKNGDVASSQCIWCLRCVEMCPYEDCLQFKFAGKTVLKSRNWLTSSNNDKVEGN